MPLLDVTIPDGALAPDIERSLLRRLMDLVLQHEGADPTRPAVQAIAWTYLHRPAAVLVGGQPPDDARYRIPSPCPKASSPPARDNSSSGRSPTPSSTPNRRSIATLTTSGSSSPPSPKARGEREGASSDSPTSPRPPSATSRPATASPRRDSTAPTDEPHGQRPEPTIRA